MYYELNAVPTAKDWKPGKNLGAQLQFFWSEEMFAFLFDKSCWTGTRKSEKNTEILSKSQERVWFSVCVFWAPKYKKDVDIFERVQ